MKIYGGLTFLAVLMAFFAGSLFLALTPKEPTQETTTVQIAQLKRDFRAKRPGVPKISPLSVYPARDIPELLSPGSVLPQTYRFPYAQIRALAVYSKTCGHRKEDGGEIVRPTGSGLGSGSGIDPRLKKEFAWQQFLCGAREKLPHAFFERPPYMSPFGGSYAAQALSHPNKVNTDSNWIESHLGNFHVTELKTVLDDIENASPLYQVLSQLDDYALLGLANKDPVVLSSGFILFQERLGDGSKAPGYSTADHSNTYQVYSRSEWNQFISDAAFLPTLTVDQSCLQKEGGICWVANQKPLFKKFRDPSLLLFGGSLFLTILSVALIFSKIRSQRLEEDRKRFALQTLTHELRTPIASLLVTSDTLMNKFDLLPKDFQTHLLLIANDTQRLRRLADVSRQYLTAHPGSKLVQFDFQKIASINDYVAKTLEAQGSAVEFHMLEKDQAFVLDPYWVSVCIKNLVENAISHGKGPVRLCLEIENRALKVTVEDAGRAPATLLGNLGEAFVKGRASSGLGLGLNIVKTIVSAMSGDFIFAQNPTTFGFKIESSS